MYRNILIATDGSELAGKGLEQGLQLAKAVGATVTVLTVSEPWIPAVDPYGYSLADYSDIETLREATEARGKTILEAAREAAAAIGVPCRTVYEPLVYPADAIVKYARDNAIDLIVMASHGRRGVQRVLLGSQATQVLTHSPIPVLIVK